MGNTNATLRVLTFDPEHPDAVILDNTQPCSGSYVCDCLGCQIERARLVKRGVRPLHAPVRRKQAA